MVFVACDSDDVARDELSVAHIKCTARHTNVCVVLSHICHHIGLASLSLLCASPRNFIHIDSVNVVVACVNVDVARFDVKTNKTTKIDQKSKSKRPKKGFK